MTIHNLDLILAVSILLTAIFMIAKNKMQYRTKDWVGGGSGTDSTKHKGGIYYNAKKEEFPYGKTKTYTCGEDVNPRELNTAQDTFYNTFIKTFKLNKLKKLHTGRLTDYLYWIFASLVIILTILVLIL